MSDLAVLVVLAFAGTYLSGAILGLACRRKKSLQLVRRVFGSARGALFAPPLIGLAIAGLAYSSHRRVLGPSLVVAELHTDVHGCVHWLSHAADDRPTALAGVLGLVLLGACIFPVLEASKRRRFQGALTSFIDRPATRTLRASLAGFMDSRHVFAVDALESSGPLSIGIGRRKTIFVPTKLDLGSQEIRAVVAHERAHIRLGHLSRRWLFEGLLAVPLSRTLLGPCLRAARSEEEWEADDEAAKTVGSGLAVARALVETARAACLAGAETANCVAGFCDGSDLRERVERLLSPRPRAPAGMGRGIVIAGILVAVLAAAQAFEPASGIRAFCGIEHLLGFSCVQ